MTTELPAISHIEKLKRQKEVIDARIQKAEARYKERERKAETRRKILLGAYYLDKIRKEGNFESVKHELALFLTRNKDRLLFGLPALEKETN
jgi:large subunit ribosomal protein L7/L12